MATRTIQMDVIIIYQNLQDLQSDYAELVSRNDESATISKDETALTVTIKDTKTASTI